jgi:hypothetical protein
VLAASTKNGGLIVSAVDDTAVSVVHPLAAVTAPVTGSSSAAVVGTTALEEAAVRNGRSERAAVPSRPNPWVETVGATAVWRSPLGPTKEAAVILRCRSVAKLVCLKMEVVEGLKLDVVVTTVSAGEVVVAVATVGIDDTRCLPRR